MVTNVIQPISNNIRLIKPDGTATDFFIRWAQTRQIDISNGITAAQAQQLIDDWAADRDIIAGTALTGGGDLSSDVTINHADSPVTPGTYGDATNIPQVTVDQQGHITNVLNVPVSITSGTVTSVNGASSASGFTLTGGPITTNGTLTFNISNAGNARTSLGLAIGTDVQAFSAKLAAYASGDIPSAFTLGIVDAVDAAAWRTAIGAGTSTVSPSALTKTDDTNVTLTLGGTPATSLLQATSITVGWTGTLSVARGGTGSGTAAGARTNLAVPEYVEGTWTPIVSSTAGSIIAYTSSGVYKKIGKAIIASATINISNNGTGANAVTVSLPFTASASAVFVTAGRENALTGNFLQVVINNSAVNALVVTATNLYPAASGAQLLVSLVYFID